MECSCNNATQNSHIVFLKRFGMVCVFCNKKCWRRDGGNQKRSRQQTWTAGSWPRGSQVPLLILYQAVKSTTVSNRSHYYLSITLLCIPALRHVNTVNKVATRIQVLPLLSRTWAGPVLSLLLSLHWLENVCNTTSQGYVNHFDMFWGKSQLLRSDGLYPNRVGTKQLKSFILHC